MLGERDGRGVLRLDGRYIPIAIKFVIHVAANVHNSSHAGRRGFVLALQGAQNLLKGY
jgi:hypothetical protein